MHVFVLLVCSYWQKCFEYFATQAQKYWVLPFRRAIIPHGAFEIANVVASELNCPVIQMLHLQ